MTYNSLICSMQEIQEELVPILQEEFLVSEEIAEDMYRFKYLIAFILLLIPPIFPITNYPVPYNPHHSQVPHTK